ncbi:MAG: hypothetical protein ABWY50_01650 [Aeromicrobium sp.]
MNRTAATLAMGVFAVAALAGCGGEDPYCAAIEENKAALDSFGTKRTEAAFTTYAKALRSVATTAPDEVKDEWAKLGSVTDGVLKAHQSVGLPLEDMTDTAKVADLDADDLETVNTAYEAFNKTGKQRTAVVQDVLERCEITLK